MWARVKVGGTALWVRLPLSLRNKGSSAVGRQPHRILPHQGSSEDTSAPERGPYQYTTLQLTSGQWSWHSMAKAHYFNHCSNQNTLQIKTVMLKTILQGRVRPLVQFLEGQKQNRKRPRTLTFGCLCQRENALQRWPVKYQQICQCL
jgi:hypothetical protein